VCSSDLASRNEHADPASFASGLLARAGPAHAVFLVEQGLYRTFGHSCETVDQDLGQRRQRETIVESKPQLYERAALVDFPATAKA